MALFYSAETVGFVLAFASSKWWKEFPSVPYDNWKFLDDFALRHYFVGVLFFAVALIDYLTFYNYPMQRRIILAKKERSFQENKRILELSQSND